MEKEKVIGAVGNLCSQLGFPTEKLSVSIETLSGGEKEQTNANSYSEISS